MRRILCFILLALIACSGKWAAARAQDDQPKPQERERPYAPPSASKSVEIANYYLKRKKYSAALSRYKEAARTDPAYAPAYLGLGKVYEKIGLKQKALESYWRYLDELPSSKQAEEAKEVHDAIARLEQELGKPAAKAATRP